jgi:hypothetical protein
MPPSGGVKRPGWVVRFARLIHRAVRVFGVPSARAACTADLNLLWCYLAWCDVAPSAPHALFSRGLGCNVDRDQAQPAPAMNIAYHRVPAVVRSTA